jgi:thiosulfate dehydrogenase
MTVSRRPVSIEAAIALSVFLSAAAVGAAAQTPAADSVPAAGVLPAPDARHGEVLYLRHCAACHRAQGWGDGPREIPALAGQREAYLIEQLARFASGARPGSAMHGPAMRDTLQATDVNRPVAMRDLAAYLARAAPVPRAEQGEGRELGSARSLYLRSCAGCHGEEGAGSGAAPRIGGQHYRYLLSRLREFGAVHGASVTGPALSAPEQMALADFTSRLPPRAATP